MDIYKEDQVSNEKIGHMNWKLVKHISKDGVFYLTAQSDQQYDRFYEITARVNESEKMKANYKEGFLYILKSLRIEK